VTTVEMTTKPVALASALVPVACPPPLRPATVAQAQAKALGLRPVHGPAVMTATTTLSPTTLPTTSLSNSMGYTDAIGASMANSAADPRALRQGLQVTFQAKKATGGNARGIPPRGRPV
jgi:hypothetical protein